jgi:UDP-N-acetyl-D-glucosamine dehydrogenase
VTASLQRLHDRTAKIVVIGQGYVGLPVAMRASQVGFANVVGFEVSPERVKALQTGNSFVGDVSDEELVAAIERGYIATDDPNDLAGFDVAVISVPTPCATARPTCRSSSRPAPRSARTCVRGRAWCWRAPPTRAPPASCSARSSRRSSGLATGEYRLGYSPERIDPGNRPHLRQHPEGHQRRRRGVAGRGRHVLRGARRHDRAGGFAPPRPSSVKLLENTFRHVNIALVNELAMFARDLGVDVWRAIDAASTKPFGYMRFTPGPGVGGHCLPIDPSYLAWRVKQHLGRTFRFVELANDINEHMPDYVHAGSRRCSTSSARASTAPRCCCSAWPTSAARATGARARAWPSPTISPPAAPSWSSATRTSPRSTPARPVPAGRLHTRVIQRGRRGRGARRPSEFDPEVIAANSALVFDAKNIMRDTAFTGRSSDDMGVRRPLALVVPWYEIALGAVLISGLLSPWAEILAALTLVAFTVVIVQRLLDGSRPPCACFGSRSNKPLGRRHVARNLGLLAVAALAIIGTA